MSNAQYYTSHDNQGGAQDDEDMESKKRAMSALMDMLQTKDQSNYMPDQDGDLDQSKEGTDGTSELSLLGDEAEGSPDSPSPKQGKESVLMKDAELKKKLRSLGK